VPRRPTLLVRARSIVATALLFARQTPALLALLALLALTACLPACIRARE
jgi:hypothetical protein